MLHAKEAKIRKLGSDEQVYKTRAKTKDKPELVPDYHTRANPKKHDGTPAHFHERIQLWGQRGMLAVLEEAGREIAEDGPQTVQALALALREEVASARALAQNDVEQYIQWLESLLPAVAPANGGAEGGQGLNPPCEDAPASSALPTGAPSHAQGSPLGQCHNKQDERRVCLQPPQEAFSQGVKNSQTSMPSGQQEGPGSSAGSEHLSNWRQATWALHASRMMRGALVQRRNKPDAVSGEDVLKDLLQQIEDGDRIWSWFKDKVLGGCVEQENRRSWKEGLVDEIERALGLGRPSITPSHARRLGYALQSFKAAGDTTSNLDTSSLSRSLSDVPATGSHVAEGVTRGSADVGEVVTQPDDGLRAPCAMDIDIPSPGTPASSAAGAFEPQKVTAQRTTGTSEKGFKLSPGEGGRAGRKPPVTYVPLELTGKVTDGKPARAQVYGRTLVLSRPRPGEVLATWEVCPHRGASLAGRNKCGLESNPGGFSQEKNCHLEPVKVLEANGIIWLEEEVSVTDATDVEVPELASWLRPVNVPLGAEPVAPIASATPAKKGSLTLLLERSRQPEGAGEEGVGNGTGAMDEDDEALTSGVSKRARDLREGSAGEAGTKRQRPMQTSMGFGFDPGSPLVQALDERNIPSGALESPLRSHASRAASFQAADEDSDLHEFLESMSDQTGKWISDEEAVPVLAIRARELLSVLQRERMHDSVGYCRATLAAERLRPVVDCVCDVSAVLWGGEWDPKKLSSMLGALVAALPLPHEGLADLESEEHWIQVARRLHDLVDRFNVPEKFLEDPLVQARLAAAHQSLARALERAGRTAEAAAEDDKADAIHNWVCIFPAPGHTLVQPEICSITRQPMKDPVIIESGHTFERAAIERWFKKHNTCPITRVKLRRRTMIPNKAVKQYTDLYNAATGGWIPTPTWSDPEPTPPESNIRDPLKFSSADMEAVFGVPKEVLKETQTWLADDGDGSLNLEASFNELTVTDGGAAPTAGLREEWVGGGEPILPGLEVEVGS
ncbi:U box domain containing protein [Klebsormidium nitens]|uniref:U box domain containing protein n=1 Tax=Klebsormidium nitens TaxID=105231 RepID=A0A1Y1I3Q1_KLENI|nr:U box domain containing protein [Klebsormidium nitens]|eukprot:GAQ82728.1 U box domain containing protein [Klebsormidium nitens]